VKFLGGLGLEIRNNQLDFVGNLRSNHLDREYLFIFRLFVVRKIAVLYIVRYVSPLYNADDYSGETGFPYTKLGRLKGNS